MHKKDKDKDKLKKSLGLNDNDFKEAENFENEVLGKPTKKDPPTPHTNPWSGKNESIFCNDDEPDADGEVWDERKGKWVEADPDTEWGSQLDMFGEEVPDMHARGIDEHFGYGVVDREQPNCIGVAVLETLTPGKYDVYVTRDAFGKPVCIKIIIPND